MAIQEINTLMRFKKENEAEYIVYPATKTENVVYDNASSGLVAEDVQEAIDELADRSYKKADVYSKAEIDEKLSSFSSGGSGIIISDTTPPGDASKFWVDTSIGGVLKYWDGSAWVSIKSIWG